MSALDEMTKGISTRKDQKAAELSPVGLEPGGIPDATMFLGNEAIESLIRQLRQVAKDASRYADGLETGLGKAPPPPLKTDIKALEAAAQKQREEEGDAKAFAADMARKAAAAQAATFKPEPDAGHETGWACPKHGREKVFFTESAKGRPYHLCQVTGCNQFEK